MQFEKEKLLSIMKPGAVCALCGETLADNPKHPSVLRRVEEVAVEAASGEETTTAEPVDDAEEEAAPEFIRTDYHAECWAKIQKEDYLSFWLAKRPAPPVTPKMSKQERNTALMTLFVAVMKTNDPVDDPIRFVVSHLLMKYKALFLAPPQVDKNGLKTIVFEVPQTEERFEIPDIRLSDEHLVETMARIEEFLLAAQSGPVVDDELNDQPAE